MPESSNPHAACHLATCTGKPAVWDSRGAHLPRPPTLAARSNSACFNSTNTASPAAVSGYQSHLEHGPEKRVGRGYERSGDDCRDVLQAETRRKLCGKCEEQLVGGPREICLRECGVTERGAINETSSTYAIKTVSQRAATRNMIRKEKMRWGRRATCWGSNDVLV